MPPIPAGLFRDTGEAPQRDCARPHGIPFDRSLCPPDDAQTDAVCAVAAAVANARIDCGLDVLDVAPDPPSGAVASMASTPSLLAVDGGVLAGDLDRSFGRSSNALEALHG